MTDFLRTPLGDSTRGWSRRAARAALALPFLTLAACNTVLPHRVQAGGSFLYTLDSSPSAPLGFASTLAGPDVQRGAVQFVLCPPQVRLCDTGGAAGFALETQLLTRVGLDPFSPAGLAGRLEDRRLGLSAPLPAAALAVLRIPSRAEAGPAPGRYRIEARVTTQSGTRDLFNGAGAALEILPGEGEPASLPMPLSVAQVVPLPRITLTATQLSAGRAAPARSGPAAAELLIRYPAEKVAIRGAAEVGSLGQRSMLWVASGPTPGTVRVALLAPQRDVRQIGIAFEPLARDPAPVRAAEFEIAEQRLYDERGALDDSLVFAIEGAIQ
jgi:hypothetical protein